MLPVEQVLYSSGVAHVGSFSCPADDPLFHDSGPTRNHLFVFPRTTIAIEHDDKPPFVSTAHGVTLYNRGQHYQRRVVDPEAGDVCDFFAVSPDLLVDALRAHDRSVEDHADAPFRIPYTEIPASIFENERELVEWMRSGDRDALEIEEGVIWLLDMLAGTLPRAAEQTPLPRSAADRVEQAKAVLARDIDQPRSIAQIADATSTSIYYLCKIFRRHTGLTMTTYRQQLRLRLAFDEVMTSHDLLATALRFGFTSHSYFTYAFRSYFGMTPSELRAKYGTASVRVYQRNAGIYVSPIR
jgi:AraC-like DNA-binding protein